MSTRRKSIGTKTPKQDESSPPNYCGKNCWWRRRMTQLKTLWCIWSTTLNMILLQWASHGNVIWSSGQSCVIVLFLPQKLNANMSNKLSHLQPTSEIELILFGSLPKQSQQDPNLLHFWTQIPSSSPWLAKTITAQSALSPKASLRGCSRAQPHVYVRCHAWQSKSETLDYIKAQPCDTHVF